MSRSNKKGTKRRRQTLQVWSFARAKAALPYLSSVLTSLREHRLRARRHQVAARRLDQKPGRPGRDTLIAAEEHRREARSANERFQEALEELEALDVYCLDPVRGQALVPFVHDNQLAWYVYDQFDPEPFRTWRYHSDPLDTRRPIAEAQQGMTETTMIC